MRREIRKRLIAHPMVAVALLLLLVLTGVPRFRVHPGQVETAAIARLRGLHSAQAAFQKAGHVDRDGDGIGEFGTLGELTGTAHVRGADPARRLDSPLLARSWAPHAGGGMAQWFDYRFRLFLPGKEGRLCCADWTPEEVDVDRSEETWCAFAWPRWHPCGTWRTFRIDETGVVRATKECVDPSALPEVEYGSWTIVR